MRWRISSSRGQLNGLLGPWQRVPVWLCILLRASLPGTCLFSLSSFHLLSRWQKIFKSRLVELVVSYGNTFFVVLIIILVLLLLGE